MSREKTGGSRLLAPVLTASVLAVVILCSPLILGLLATTKTVGNQGAVKALGVGVYSDSNCSSAVSAINWGAVEPGTSKNSTVYVKNQGNAPVTLSMSTANWNPANASNYLTLSWDYGGQAIDPGAAVRVTLTLSMSAAIKGIDSFSFDIIITATG